MIKIRDLPLWVAEGLDLDGKLRPDAAQRPTEPLPRGRGHANGEQMNVQNPRSCRTIPVDLGRANQMRSLETVTLELLSEPVARALDVCGGQRSDRERFQKDRRNFVLAGTLTSRWRATRESIRNRKATGDQPRRSPNRTGRCSDMFRGRRRFRARGRSGRRSRRRFSGLGLRQRFKLR